jgi:hypothetical protein
MDFRFTVKVASTLLAQIRYVVSRVAIESFLNMESDGLKAKLQQGPTHPERWSAPFRASGSKPTRLNGDLPFAIW